MYKCYHNRPLLRAARELRTVIQSGWHSYAMDAAVKVLRNEEPFDEETMRWMEKVHPQTNSRQKVKSK